MTESANAQVVTSLCYSCPIAQKLNACRAVYPRFPSKEAKYFFLAEAPGKTEEEEGEVLVGDAGQKFRETLEKANIDLEDCFLTNAAWCAPRSSPSTFKIDTPRADEVLHCLPHSLHYIRQLRPKVIVAMGAVAYQALCGKPPKGKTITKSHGSWITLDLSVFLRYQVMWMWLSEVGKYEELEWSTDERVQAQQITWAKENGYDESWIDTPVFLSVHPSFVVRSGPGRWEESFYFDLVKLRAAVEGTEGGRSIFEEQAAQVQASVEQAQQKYRWINSVEELEQYVNETIYYYENGNLEVIACDIETVTPPIPGLKKGNQVISLFPYDPRTRVLCVQFSRFKDEAVAIMVNHKVSVFNEPVAFGQLRHHLKRLVETIPQVGQNYIFDSHVWQTFFGIKDIKVVGDTLLMDHWFNAGSNLAHDLDSLGARYVSGGELHKQGWKDWENDHPGATMEDAPLEILLGYSAGDADVTLQVYYHLRGQLQAQGRWQAYYDLHHGVHNGWEVINDLEFSGMPVDQESLDRLNEEYPRRILECHKAINEVPYVVVLNQQKLETTNAKIREHNDDIENLIASGKKTRKRPKQELTYDDYMGNTDNWFNPGSVQQVTALWRDIMHIPFEQIEDLEYNDDCPRCKRAPCRCKRNKYVHQKPSTNEHNRKVIRKTFSFWSKQWKELADVEQDPEKKQQYASTAGNCALVSQVLLLQDTYKKMTKMYGTYVNGIYPLIIDKPKPSQLWDPKERCFPLYKPYADFPAPWKIHGSFLMHGTETGRLASRNPNCQNYPHRNADPDANVKLPYVSRWKGKGGIILQPDYSQIEVRVMVMMCQDEVIAAQINEGKDIHKVVASMVHKVAYEDVTKELRGPCKQITFGILYGQGIGTLAQDLQIPYKEAQDLQERFFAQLPKVKVFVEQQKEFLRRNGYVESLFGRRRYIPNIHEADEGKRAEAERMAVNSPIQSTASDLCWSAYGRSWKHIQEVGIEAYPYSIIHDSQSFDVSPGRWLDVAELQYYHMVYEPYEFWDWISVKPEADFDIGAGWGRLVGMKVGFDNEQNPDHNTVTLVGPRADIEALCEEFVNAGEKFQVLEDQEHPDKNEAELGVWWRKLYVERPDPICWLEGRKLVTRKK